MNSVTWWLIGIGLVSALYLWANRKRRVREVQVTLPSNIVCAAYCVHDAVEHPDMVLNLDTRELGQMQDGLFKAIRAATDTEVRDCLRLDWYRST